jgi:hypothetical protein
MFARTMGTRPQLGRSLIEEGDFPVTVYGVDCCRKGLQEIDEFVVSIEASVTPQCTDPRRQATI